MIELIPSLDIYKKKIIRLVKGKIEKKKVYNIKIKKIIEFFKKKNFKKVNIIDIEGSMNSKIKNFKIISNYIKKFNNENIKVRVGGGIRNIKGILKYIKKGADKVILSSIIKKKDIFKKIIKKIKNKIIVSLDINNEKIMLNGWKKEFKKTKKILNLIKKYNIEVIVTNIEKDGTLKGIDNKFINKTLKRLKIGNVFFSGGLNSFEEVKEIKNKKVLGYIFGKYIFKCLKE